MKGARERREIVNLDAAHDLARELGAWFERMFPNATVEVERGHVTATATAWTLRRMGDLAAGFCAGINAKQHVDHRRAKERGTHGETKNGHG